MELPLGKALYIIQSKDRSLDERLNVINTLSTQYSRTELESNFGAVMRVLNPILSRALAGDPDEKVICVNLLKQLGLISEKSDKIAEQYLLFLINLFKGYKTQEIDIDLLITIISALRYPLRKNPWKFFEITPLLKEVLQSKPRDSVYEHIFKLLGDVAWEIPYVVNDFSNTLENVIFSEKTEIKSLALKVLSSAGKRSFRAIKRFILGILERGTSFDDPQILELLTSIHIPADYENIAEQIYVSIYEKYVSKQSIDEEAIEKIKLLAQLLSREELYSLQKRLLEDVISLFPEAPDETTLTGLIEATMIPIWHKELDLTQLYTTYFELLQDETLSSETRLLIIEAVQNLILQRTELVVDALTRLVNMVEFIDEDILKEKILDIVRSLFYFIKETDLVDNITSVAMKLLGDITESLSVRQKAGDILELIAKHVPDKIVQHGAGLSDLFNEITEWSIRDFIIKIAGETLRKIKEPEKNLVQALIRGLFDNMTYTIALDYLNIAAYKFPTHFVEYLDELGRFLTTLKEWESVIIAEESLESYYHFVEEPKRLSIKILTSIALNLPTREPIKKIINILIDMLRDETNEIIKKDISNSLKEISSIDNALANYIRETAERNNVINVLREYEFMK